MEDLFYERCPKFDLRKRMNCSVRDENIDLLNCHIETENLESMKLRASIMFLIRSIVHGTFIYVGEYFRQAKFFSIMALP